MSTDASQPSGRRVALLALPGAARDQLRDALLQAGAQLVLEADPNTTEPQALLDAQPQTVLVALEPAIEDSLARFDEVLLDPAVAVIFDEAELAAKRDGWDAKRWVRHLAAKLNGHSDVLPPGAELDDSQLEPGLPASPAQLDAGVGIESYLEEARDLADELPRGGLENGGEPADQGLELMLESLDQAPVHAAAVAPVPVASEDAVANATAPEAGSGLVLELESLESSSASAATGVRGALLLFAGIGGPDAVRKVLAALPEDLARPVLVQLRLDGGLYDNLVKQMERVSVLPVQMAGAGDVAQPGHVYVLSNEVAVAVVEGVVRFSEGQLAVEDLIASLPPAESAVLLLSGSDPSQVEPALALAAQGGFLGGQAPQGCYDPAASKALLARGGNAASPEELAAQLALHWQA
ncbi:MAG: chemotaxis protein [Pseudoxanthomonas sp.]|nr:chemotaxis protein [Pseudoxanthomonas sp.]